MTSSAATTATFCATLVDEWASCGVRHAVISPGSRSTPMAMALAAREDIQLHVFHDERSASFAAIGIAKASGLPAILLCTSGTAAVEFHSAVVEANHAEVPILVCTADRPPELQNVGAPQTINQQNLYGDSVRLFHNSGVPNSRDSRTWRYLAQELFNATLGQIRGPVHLNLQFRETLVAEANTLPKKISVIKNQLLNQEIGFWQKRKLLRLLKNQSGVIIAGFDTYEPKAVLELATKLGWPIFADPRSGTRVVGEAVVIAAMDSLLRDNEFAESHNPSVILRIGSPPVSKIVNAWLAKCDVPQIVITRSSRLVDPEQKTTLHVAGEVTQICSSLIAQIKATNQNWLDSWSNAERKAQLAINHALISEPAISEPAISRTIYRNIPDGSNLFVSSSMPIRDIEWFAAPRSRIKVHANRGVNGIDGVVSTAVGVALASNAPTFLLIGDLAMLHDTNGLINLARRQVDLRIILIDNRGGGIFSFLPQATSLNKDSFEMIFGTPHNVDFELLAKAHGIDSNTVTNLDQLTEAISRKGPYLVRVVTDRDENVRVHERINQRISASLRES